MGEVSLSINDLFQKILAIRRLRADAKFSEARDILKTLMPLSNDMLPKLEYRSKMGISADVGAAIFYINHDWDEELDKNSWCNVFIAELYNALFKAKAREPSP